MNNSFLVYLNEQFTKNPCVDFSGAFERYKVHLSSIIAPLHAVASMDISPIKRSEAQPMDGKIETRPAVSMGKPEFKFQKEVFSLEASSFPAIKPAESEVSPMKDVEKPKISFTFSSPAPIEPERKPDVIFCFPTSKTNIDKPGGITVNSGFNPENTPPKKPDFSFTFGQNATVSPMEISKSPFQTISGSPFASVPADASVQSTSMVQESEEEQETVAKEATFELPSEESLKVLEEKPCKLFLSKGNEYSDKGVCMLRLAELNDGKKCIIARVRGTGKLMINSPLTNACKVIQVEGKRDLLLLCFDLNGKLARFLLRLKTVEEAQALLKFIQDLLLSV